MGCSKLRHTLRPETGDDGRRPQELDRTGIVRDLFSSPKKERGQQQILPTRYRPDPRGESKVYPETPYLLTAWNLERPGQMSLLKVG